MNRTPFFRYADPRVLSCSKTPHPMSDCIGLVGTPLSETGVHTLTSRACTPTSTSPQPWCSQCTLKVVVLTTQLLFKGRWHAVTCALIISIIKIHQDLAEKKTLTPCPKIHKSLGKVIIHTSYNFMGFKKKILRWFSSINRTHSTMCHHKQYGTCLIQQYRQLWKNECQILEIPTTTVYLNAHCVMLKILISKNEKKKKKIRALYSAS